VRYKHNRSAFFMQGVQQAHDFFACRKIEIACRFVGKNQRRIVNQRTRDSHALLLAAGKLGREVIGAITQTDAL
jgi:hypothetical protein